MARYPFLSDEWFAAAREVVDADTDDATPRPRVSINLTVTGTPFGEDRVLHLSTAGDVDAWGMGHLDSVDLTLTTDYETARQIFMTGTAQYALQAFMEGRVKLQGDLTKLMAAQTPGDGKPGILEALATITE